MSTSSREILDSFDLLPETEKREVAIEIIRRAFIHDLSGKLDETQIAALYAEFAVEDLALAEHGLEDYVQGLAAEDVP